jgi:adenylate kinase family enzyme
MKRAATSGRVDDREETIFKRIKLFHDVSGRVVQEYSAKVISIPADRNADDIFDTCCSHVQPIMDSSKSTKY